MSRRTRQTDTSPAGLSNQAAQPMRGKQARPSKAEAGRQEARPSKAQAGRQEARPSKAQAGDPVVPEKPQIGSTPSERMVSLLVKLASAWVYALSLTRILLHGREMPSGGLVQPVAMLLLILLLALLTWGRYNLLATGTVAFVTAAGLFLTRDAWFKPIVFNRQMAEIRSWFTWVSDWAWGYASGNQEQFELLAYMICLAVAAVSYLLVARFNAVFVAAVGLAVVMLILRHPSDSSFFFWAAVGTFPIIAGLARRQGKLYRLLKVPRSWAQTRLMVQSLPVSLLALVLAAILSMAVPVNLIHSRSLEGLLDDLTSIVTGKSWNESSLPDFSLQPTGYYPLVDRLGGPVFLSNQPALLIRGTDEELLLKGAVSQTYDGSSWRQDPEQSFYRYGSPLWLDEQRSVFDLDLPDLQNARLRADQVFRETTFTWSTLGQPARIIFMAGRPLTIGLTGNEPFQAYFRPSSQLFSKYWLSSDQSIEVQSKILRSEQTDFASLVRRIQANLPDSERIIPDDVRTRYLQMPALDPYEQGGTLDELVKLILRGETDPYRQVLLIRKYVLAVGTYNLLVSVPPADVEFVSWFLQTREGYCVYFATALTMLCRLAGIPARYVEGYYAPPASSEGADRILTGENAHAWTEVYLAGIGWIPVDATPGAATTQPDVIDPLTPTPGPTLTPTAPPATPTVPGNLTPTPAVTPGPGRRPLFSDLDWPSPWWLLLLLLLPVLVPFFNWKRLKRSHDHHQVADILPTSRLRTLFYWQQITLLLNLLGSRARTGETPGQYLTRQVKTGNWLAGRAATVESARIALEQTIFSHEQPAEEQVKALAAVYLVLEKTLQQNKGKLSYWIRRVILQPPVIRASDNQHEV